VYADIEAVGAAASRFGARVEFDPLVAGSLARSRLLGPSVLSEPSAG
jgi:hypothetical protein